MKSLAPLPFATSRVDLLLQCILAVAAEQDDYHDRQLGPIHLLKYVYLADLAYAKGRDGETFTGTDWRFHHFGPWAIDVFQRIEPALEAVGAERTTFQSKFADDAVRYRLHRSDAFRVRERAERELPSDVQFAITRAIQAHGRDTASLLRAVYQTPPMLYASPDEQLDFSVVRESPAVYETPVEHGVSRNQRKKRQQRLNEIRAGVQARLAAAAQVSGTPVPAPRYDDVFAAGDEWLDSLAGEPITESGGTLEIGADVWKSDARRGSEIP